MTLGFLRLSPPVDAIFFERMTAAMPLRAERLLSRTRDGSGHYRAAIEALYASTCRRLGLSFSPPGDDFANTPSAGPLERRTFRRPPRAGDQIRLF